jgi:hypothetical protein
MNPKPRAPSIDDFDFDTLTLGGCWPWIKGAFIVMVGSMVAGFVWMFSGSWVPGWSLPRWMAGVDCLDCVDGQNYAIC